MSTRIQPVFDAVVPFHPKDSDILPYCIAGLKRNVRGLRNIYVISKDEPEDIDDIIWIPEARFPFTLLNVASIIKNTTNREGWYLQQLLKLYAFRVINDIEDHVLVFDADCVPCRPIEFFDESGRILFDSTTNALYESYFTHATRVLGDVFQRVDPNISGICDHMMFRRDILESMLQKIEIYNKKEAWRSLLEAVDPAEYDRSGMSEYEMYYNYALSCWSDVYTHRNFARECATSIRALAEGSNAVDLMVFHRWIMDQYKNEILLSKMV